jgi:hypothetical protein
MKDDKDDAVLGIVWFFNGLPCAAEMGIIREIKAMMETSKPVDLPANPGLV